MWDLIYQFLIIAYLFTSCGPNNTYHSSTQGARKTGLSYPKKFITDRSKAVLLLWFILIVNVRPLSVGL